MYPPWARYYIDYKGLKKVIKDSAASEPVNNNNSNTANSNKAEQNKLFFIALDRDLDKVLQFYSRKLKEFESHLQFLCMRADTSQSQSQTNVLLVQSLLESFQALEKDLLLLKEFAGTNSTGFRKILKKHDKVLQLKTQEIYLGNKVYVEQSFGSDSIMLNTMISTVEKFIEIEY